MDIELLKTFLEVNNVRHFGQAADSLCLTQAAVSSRIRQLETILGVRLFIRDRNNIQLTEAGERLVSHAETLLLGWSKASREVALQSDQLSQIEIGVSNGLWSEALSKKVGILHQCYSSMLFNFDVDSFDALMQKLLARKLDMAISCDSPSVSDLKATSLGSLSLILMSSDGACVAEALAKNYVYIDWGRAFAMFHARRFSESVQSVMRTNSELIALDFIQESGGAAYFPKHREGILMNQGLVAVTDAPVFKRSIKAVYRVNSERIDLINQVLGVFSEGKHERVKYPRATRARDKIRVEKG